MTESVHSTATPIAEDAKQSLEVLRDPAALHAIKFMSQQGWLAVSMKSLEDTFGEDKQHPARELLTEQAQHGGKLGLLQYAILSGFFGLAFLLTMFKPNMPLVLFAMWGALGVAIVLLSRNHPSLIFGDGLKKAMKGK